MNEVALDTNALIAWLKRDKSRLEQFQEQIDGLQWVLSFAVVAEIRLGFRTGTDWGGDKQRIRSIEDEFESLKGDAILAGPTTQIIERAVGLAYAHNVDKKKSGKKEAAGGDFEARHSSRWHDFWIAATALERRIPVVSFDKHFKRFRRAGLEIIGLPE